MLQLTGADRAADLADRLAAAVLREAAQQALREVACTLLAQTGGDRFGAVCLAVHECHPDALPVNDAHEARPPARVADRRRRLEDLVSTRKPAARFVDSRHRQECDRNEVEEP